MVSLSIGKEQAAALDKMLHECDNKAGYFEYNESNCEKYNSLLITADILERVGYVKILVQQGSVLIVQIRQAGKTFIKNDSFLSQIKDKEEEQLNEKRKREMEDATHQLTLKKIKAANREPYYIAFVVISGILNLILSYLHFFKN